MSSPSFDRILAATLKFYCRNFPSDKGKFRIWKHVFRSYLSKRALHLEATSFFGARFHTDLADFVQASIYVFGSWEPVISAYLKKYLRPGDVFVDVGANIGYYSVLAAQAVGGGGKVYSIEASPNICKLLNRNLELNAIGNAEVFNLAATDEPCQLPIWVGNDANIGQTTVVQGMSGRASGIVETIVEGRPLGQIVPLDDLLNARIIKIDVEGEEWMVLQGIKDLMPRLSDRTEILVEACVSALAKFGVSIEDFLGVFREAGFVPFMIDGLRNEPYYPMGDPEPAIVPLPSPFPDSDMVDLLFRRIVATH
jgi:FkbM family methyltransferase